MEAELYRELCAQHTLFGCSAKAIGHRIDEDDFLFQLEETPPRFAVVHLTFRKESTAEWPYTSLFSSLEEWVAQCLIPDSVEYAESQDETEP